MPLEPEPDSYRILAVDDSPDNLFLIETILDEPQYHVTCVESGDAAIKAVYRSWPDLILLDVMMPDMDGYEVTRQLRRDQTLPYIPILLITAHDRSSLVEGLDAGADEFIRKPVDVNELRARVRSMLRLKRSMDAQSQMIRQRDDFVARLTHDLRTPLVAANRMLKLFQDSTFGPISDEANEALGTIIDSNHHLLNMVNTLLEVHRHEAGNKTLALAPLNLESLATTVVQELRPLAEAKGVACELVLTAPSRSIEDPTWQVKGDSLELRRVLTNLVGNAIKFTDRGRVTVTLSHDFPTLVDEDDSETFARNQDWVAISVADTGIGIAPEEQANIFERFRQGYHRRAGHGLGLHLSQRLAQLHGGHITVTSTPGQGSCFTLYLPTQAAIALLTNTKSAENLVKH